MKNGEFLQLSGGGLQALDSLTADLGLTKSEFQAGGGEDTCLPCFLSG